MGSNFGATLLDVQQGMEYAKANQRRDAEWERNQKRADMQDKTAQYGLEDLERTRTDAAGDRAATAGLGLTDAAGVMSKRKAGRGDIKGAQEAAGATLTESDLAFQKSMNAFRELQAKTQTINAEGEAARAPGLNTIADNKLKAALMDAGEDVVYRAGTILAQPGGSKEFIRTANAVNLFGQKLVGVERDAENDAIRFVGEGGKEIGAYSISRIRDVMRRRSPKPEFKTVNAGDTLVKVSENGSNVTPAYTAPNKPVAGKFVYGPNGQRMNTATGIEMGAPSGPLQGSNKAVMDQVKMGIDKVLLPEFGGRFEGGMFFPDQQNKEVATRAAVLLEENILSGKFSGPVAAAADASKRAKDEIGRGDFAKKTVGSAATNPEDITEYRGTYIRTPQ